MANIFIEWLFFNIIYVKVVYIFCSDSNFISTQEIIKKFGYSVEKHIVVTEDEYVLEIHRIPFGKDMKASNKIPVLLQHGLLASSSDWILSGPRKSLGFLLSDRGYDVWMGNTRGNTYSRKHVKLKPDEDKFWDYSWHEMGIYDIPGVIDYILNITGERKLFYIGHSQGTTIFYVMCSEKPEYNNKIQTMISLAPSAYISHMKSPLFQFSARHYTEISLLFKTLNVKEFMPASSIPSNFFARFCKHNKYTNFVCTNFFYLLFGFNEQQQNKTLLPLILAHTPAGASVKQILHYLQEIKSGEFQQYDYGFMNLIKYQKFYPPQYNLSKVTAPVYLFYSHNDWLSAEIDVLRLYQELSNPIKLHLIEDKNFNHLDYIWAKNAEKILFCYIFEILNKNELK